MLTKHSRNLAAFPALDYHSMNTAEKSEPNQEQTFIFLLKFIASAINLGQQSVLMHLFRQHLKKGHLPHSVRSFTVSPYTTEVPFLKVSAELGSLKVVS